VILVTSGRGKRGIFVKCSSRHPDARLRYRARKPGETLANMQNDYRDNESITGHHVSMVLATVVRMGVLGKKSLYEVWSTADEGASLPQRMCVHVYPPTHVCTHPMYTYMHHSRNGC